MPSILEQCSFAYPPTATQVTPGTVLVFAVSVPSSALGLLPLAEVASTITWLVTDGATGARLKPGDDYQIQSGGLNELELAFVVNPVKSGSVKVQPLLEVVAGGQTPLSAGWNPVQYALSPAAERDLEAVVTSALTDALQLASSGTLLEPGATAALQVLPKPLTPLPQVATSILHELPSVEIRGAIPLGELVSAVIGPLGGAIGRVLPSAASALTSAEGDVAKLLAEPVAIPLAIDIDGRRVTRTLEPLTTQLAPTVTSDPSDPMNLTGAVPVNGFLAQFGLSSTTAATWSVTSPKETPVSANLSPNLNLLQTLLLRPAVKPPGATDLAPTPVDVTVTLEFDLPALQITDLSVKLGPVRLLRLPLVLPQFVAVFVNAFDDYSKSISDQKILLSTDSLGAVLMPSLDAVTRVLSTLSSVLDTISQVVSSVVAGNDPNRAYWEPLLTLGQGVNLIVGLLGSIPAGARYYQPVYTAQGSKTLNGDWDDSISALIHVGVPADEAGQVYFRLSDSNGTDSVEVNSPRSATKEQYICVLADFNTQFEDIVQYPGGTAWSNEPNTNPNDRLEILNFLADTP
jgi:hypothetical protein